MDALLAISDPILRATPISSKVLVAVCSVDGFLVMLSARTLAFSMRDLVDR